MAAIFGERKIFGKLPIVHCLVTLWVEIALSRTVKEIEANLRVFIFGKIRKFKMAANFWREKIFSKIATSIFLRYPVG